MKNKVISYLMIALMITALAISAPALAENKGKLNIYTSVPTVQLNMITDMFTTKYPGRKCLPVLFHAHPDAR